MSSFTKRSNSPRPSELPFAYPINKQTKGYYVILTVNGNSEGLAEFDRLVKLDNAVLRHLIIKPQE